MSGCQGWRGDPVWWLVVAGMLGALAIWLHPVPVWLGVPFLVNLAVWGRGGTES